MDVASWTFSLLKQVNTTSPWLGRIILWDVEGVNMISWPNDGSGQRNARPQSVRLVVSTLLRSHCQHMVGHSVLATWDDRTKQVRASALMPRTLQKASRQSVADEKLATLWDFNPLAVDPQSNPNRVLHFPCGRTDKAGVCAAIRRNGDAFDSS